MIGKICGIIYVLSFLFGCLTGNIDQLGGAVIDGASNAVTLTLELMGMMCLWSGVMRVAEVSGVVEKMSKLMSPILRVLFPDACKKNNGLGEIAASISANVFGIGNAATPLAVCAMEKLQENNDNKDVASNDMIMFAVLGTASFDIFPTTLIALRRAVNSQNPFEIIVPVWICSFFTAAVGVLLVKGFCAFSRK